MESRAGTSSRFISGCDSEPLKTGWRLKPGPRKHKGVVTSRRGVPSLLLSALEDKGREKIGLFSSPDLWTQQDGAKTCLGTICPNPLRMKNAGHALRPMSYCGDEKIIKSGSVSTCWASSRVYLLLSDLGWKHFELFNPINWFISHCETWKAPNCSMNKRHLLI